MAERVTTPPPKRNPRAALLNKLEHAPEQHAEALLDAYEILQLLREKGVLEITKGLLGSGEKVLWILTQTLENRDVIAFTRNFVTLIKIFGAIKPTFLEAVETSLSKSVEEAKGKNPPGLLHILKRLSNKDSRRALHTISLVTETIGKNLQNADGSEGPRKKTFRHNA